MKIQIGVLVGSNGKWDAVRFEGEKTDWVFASDQIGTYDEEGNFAAPAEQRYIVSTEVEIPEAPAVKEIEGEAVKA
jgi:hypothetical protein